MDQEETESLRKLDQLKREEEAEMERLQKI
jgi:hypothetical protein